MKRKCFFYYMLSKRLFHKLSFLALLVLIPVIVMMIGHFGKQESGIMQIVLYQEDRKDTISSNIVDSLLQEESILFFQEVDSEEEAYEAVRKNEADVAWIFPKNMGEKIETFVQKNGRSEKLIRVIEREDTIALQLAREKLYGALYPSFSYVVYEYYMEENVIQNEEDKEKLQEYYDKIKVEGTLFEFAFLDGERYDTKEQQTSYLVAPLRGILALVILLAGLASSLYYLKDEEIGVFAWLPLRKRQSYFYLYPIASMTYISFIVFISLATQGIVTNIAIELGSLVFYILMCILFCSILTSICKTIKNLGILLPMIMLVSFLFSPIFFTIEIKPINYLLPTFYYLNSIHNIKFFLWMGIYCIIGIFINKILTESNKSRSGLQISD